MWWLRGVTVLPTITDSPMRFERVQNALQVRSQTGEDSEAGGHEVQII